VADLRVFLRKQGLSATGKKVELVQRVIDHLNSGDSETESETESEVEEEQEAEEGRKASNKGGQESDNDDDDGEEESEQESDDDQDFEDDEEYEYDDYEADPDLHKVLRRLDNCCEERKPGLPMKEINRFECELQTKVRERILKSQSQSPTPRLTNVSHHGATRVCGLCVGAVRSWAPIAFASPMSCDSCTASATA
jgi:TATA-binding protein-associated factor Taf7